MQHRLRGISQGKIDTKTDELRFNLTVDENRSVSFVTEYGTLVHVMGALGQLFVALRDVVHQKKHPVLTFADEVASALIQRDRWANVVLIQLTTLQGIPHTFALSSEEAVQMAEKLKTEAAKSHQTGNA